MGKKAFDWKRFIFVLVLLLIVTACNGEEPVAETPEPDQPEATAAVEEVEPTPTVEEATAVPEEPTSVPTEEATEPEPEEVSVVFEAAPVTEDEPFTFDFESGEQGWIARTDEGEPTTVTVVSDIANSGSQSLLITDRVEDWNGATVDVSGIMEPGNNYEVTAYVRLAEGEPDSRVILTMQRTPTGGETTYEWISPSLEDGVTDSAWVELKGQYSFAGEVDELMLYLESSDEELVDFYIDDVTIALLPGEQGSISYDFEDGTQGWGPRGDAVVSTSSDAANEGSQSLSVSGRLEDWQGAGINMASLLQPDTTYQISAYVRLAEGEPDSRIILTMQRTPTGGSTQYDWIAPSEEDGVTDAEWVLLEGQYSFTGDVSELVLYLESPDEELVDFYVDDISIVGGSAIELPVQTDIPSLYETLADYFLVGAALAPEQLDSERHTTLLTKHFNSITPENAMKPGPLQPEEGEFNWDTADRMVEFAKENGIAIHGHTLVWHQQAAEWMFEDEEGNPLEPTEENKELVLQRMEDHIRAVVDRYKDDIIVWDVVNEVIDESEADCMRRSSWYELTGKDYIVRAFEIAREVDPDAVLLINDYSTTNPDKRACIYNLVEELQGMGVPVDGIGMQMHINIQYPTAAAVEDTIKKFAELGEVHITELDMSIYANDTDSYESVPEEVMVKQGFRYQEIFEVLKEQADSISSVTFWGMGDDHTWLKTFPVARINLPLPFDEQLQAKYAFWGIVDPTQLPVEIQLDEVPKGTAVIDGEPEVVWIAQAWDTLYETDTYSVTYQTRWDEENLYLFMNINGDTQDVASIDVFVDGNNGKTETFEDDDQQYTIQAGACAACGAFAEVSDENGTRIEAAFPLSEEGSRGNEVGFDIRLSLASQPEAPVSWNDRTHSQDTDTSKYGTLEFANAPKITAAVKGTPVIDGEEDEVWADAEEIVTDVWVVGSSGATGVAKTLWDDENLYVYVTVTDPLLSKASENVYEQDSFEVFLDENNAKTTTYEGDDSQYRINFDNEASFNGNAKAEKLTSATKLTDDGYIVELAIQFDTVVPEEGMLIGFDIQVNNDEDGDGVRDSVVEWNDPTHQGYQSTAGYGLLLLTP
jgi:endo-1,4-beta-xylanase